MRVPPPQPHQPGPWTEPASPLSGAEPHPHRASYDSVVLSPEAYRVLQRARAAEVAPANSELRLPSIPARVHLSLERAASEGDVRIRAVVVTGSGPGAGVELSAKVRRSWLERVQSGASSPEERAERTLVALAELAELPNQTTVAVRPLESGLELPFRGPVPPPTGSWLPAEYPPEMPS